MSELSAEKLRELVAKATEGVWRLHGMDLYAAPDNSSDIGLATLILRSYCCDLHGHPRTFDLSLIQYLHNNALAIADALERCERLEKALDTIANPRRGTPEEYWDVEQIGDFARLALTQPEGGKQ